MLIRSRNKMQKRILGKYTQGKPGPLLIALGAMHGNEPAGVLAIQELLDLLEKEPLSNPNFNFNGCFMGLIGNLKAYELGKRFIEKDINRQWTEKTIADIEAKSRDALISEELEMQGILEVIKQELANKNYTRCVILDLHTTSSDGGIFTIPSEYPDSLKISLELHAPVIKGMLSGLKGTTLHYFTNGVLPIDTTAVTFESGQHLDTHSPKRAIAAIINCMRTIACVDGADVENKHDELLITYSKDLPRCSELVYVHRIEDGDNFSMLPNYKNFQIIKKGEHLATDKSGPIYSKYDGRILMPLYQKQGEDGFFIVKETDLEI